MREHCPNCGSTDLVFTNGSYSVGCGCLGLLLFGWIGLLLGLLGMDNYELVCKHCGSRWPVGKPHQARKGTGCGCLFILLIIIIIIAAAGCLAAEPKTLVGAWELKNSQMREPATLYVASDGSFYGCGGVNRYFGKLAIPYKDGKFVIKGTPGVTMMFGPDLNKEQKFLQNLTTANSWKVNKTGELQLCKGDKVLATFASKVIPAEEYQKLLKPDNEK